MTTTAKAGAWTGIVRAAARSFLVAMSLSGLSGCTLWLADSVAITPTDRNWQALPLRAFLTRPTIKAESIQFCRAATCGYDAAVARFTASGAEAQALTASLTDRKALSAAIATGRPGRKPDDVALGIEAFSTGRWTGVTISLAGRKSGRTAFGVVLQTGDADPTSFVIVVAPHADLAHRLARAAAS